MPITRITVDIDTVEEISQNRQRTMGRELIDYAYTIIVEPEDDVNTSAEKHFTYHTHDGLNGSYCDECVKNAQDKLA